MCDERPGAEVLPQQPGAEVLPQQPGAEVRPQLPGAEVLPQLPGAEVRPQLPGAEVLPQQPGADALHPPPRQFLRSAPGPMSLQFPLGNPHSDVALQFAQPLRRQAIRKARPKYKNPDEHEQRNEP